MPDCSCFIHKAYLDSNRRLALDTLKPILGAGQIGQRQCRIPSALTKKPSLTISISGGSATLPAAQVQPTLSQLATFGPIPLLIDRLSIQSLQSP